MGGFEWDPKKAASNLAKHGVNFADAAVSLEDPLALTVPDPDLEGEERFICMAAGPASQVIVTVFAFVGPKVRIISARKASPSERKRYEKH